MDVKGGLVTSFGDLKRYLFSDKTQQSPQWNALHTSCGTPMANAGQWCTSPCPETEHKQGCSVAFSWQRGKVDLSILLARWRWLFALMLPLVLHGRVDGSPCRLDLLKTLHLTKTRVSNRKALRVGLPRWVRERIFSCWAHVVVGKMQPLWYITMSCLFQ